MSNCRVLINIFLMMSLLTVTSSCKQNAKDVVEVVTDAILQKVTVKLSTEENLGEISVGTGEREIQVEIKNNSSDPIRKISLEIGKGQSVLKFKPTPEFSYKSPGYGGTCKETLAPNDKCIFIIELSTRKPGSFNIPVTVNYENTLVPDKEIFNIKAVLGEDASLVFTNDKTLYDFGVLEQTDTSERSLELEIQNVGGLSAKSTELSFTNDIGNAFSLKSSTCSKNILPLEKCRVVINYRPYNNNYTDPEQSYAAKLSLNYIKDPDGKMGKLNGVYKFLSSTIEAKFMTNFAPVVFDTLIAGNKQSKTIKVSNIGYKEGVIKSLNFIDKFGMPITKCEKSSGTILNCLHTLYNFPFEVEDLNNCFGNEVNGIVGKLAGGSCYFNLTYWPSINYLPGSQLSHDFDDSSISLVYDSHWKNNENIVTKANMFNVDANFLATAIMILDNIQVENNYLPAASIVKTSDGVYEANLGRLAKISDPAYDTYLKLTFKNTGESSATLSAIIEGSSSSKEISENGIDINTFYRAVKHNSCGFVAPGATCSMNFSLTPLALGNTNDEDALMYDNVVNALKKFKIFKLNYLSGASFIDNGSIASFSTTEIRLISKLIAKGNLVFLGPLNLTFPTKANGTSSGHIINLKNVGTGNIFAIAHHPTENLFPHSNEWPYRLYDLQTLTLPATKDCYDILYPANNPLMSDTPNASKFLAPGEVCSLGVENKASEAMRILSNDYPGFYPETDRFFSEYLVGSTELWMRKGLSVPISKIIYNYYDGDVDPDNLLSVPFGLKQQTKELFITTAYARAPYLIFKEPTPFQSGILYRPGFTYPALSSTYPTNRTLNSYSVVSAYFDHTSYFPSIAHSFVKSVNSKNYFTTLPGIPNSYVYHIGTFKVGESFVGTLNLSNVGGSTATNIIVQEESITSPLSLSKLNNMTPPFPSFVASSSQSLKMEFTFNPTTAGVHKRCYLVTYNNSATTTVDQSLCVMATALNAAPKFDFKVQDIDVNYNAGTDSVTVIPTGNWTTYSSPLNDAISPPVSFSAIRNSKSYALKLIRITNSGNATAEKFSFSFLQSLNTPGTPIPEITTLPSDSGNPTCVLNMTLNVGASCDVYIKYAPTVSTTAVYSPFIGVIYERQENQFVSQSLGMQFSAVSPAILNAQSLTGEVVTSWRNPNIPLPVATSYPLNLTGFSKNDTHFILNSSSSNKVFNVQINNTSSIKASFLILNPSPTANEWNTLYSNSDVLIEGNRACFYGDDENNGAIPSDEKGFNSTSVNLCNLRFTFSGKITYATCSAWNAPIKTKVAILGGNIVANCNPFSYELTFYNYKRSASDKINFHFKGFIEPNRIQAASQLANVRAISTSATKGSISFTIPSMQEVDTSFGFATKYRIYYSTNYDDFYNSNMFYSYIASPAMTYIETTNPNITINNLNKGIYYFFKVTALRDFNAGALGTLSYVSISNINVLSLPIPDSTMYYQHDLKSLIDKTYQSNPGTMSQSIAKCQSLNYAFSIKSVNKTFKKSLINSNYWSNIISNPVNSTSYPGGDAGSVPHWLSDPAVDITTGLTLYDNSFLAGFPDFDAGQLFANNEVSKLIYQKSCSDNANCNLLNKIVGGDDVDLYYQGAFYTYPTGASAYARCYSIIACPTNPEISITNGSCVNP